MTNEVKKYLAESFIIYFDITDSAGHIFKRGTVFSVQNYESISYTAFTKNHTSSAVIYTAKHTGQDPLSYLNDIRCLAGISYVPTVDINLIESPFCRCITSLMSLNAGVILKHSIIKIQSADVISVERPLNPKNRTIVTDAIHGMNNPLSFQLMNSYTVLENINKLNDIEMQKTEFIIQFPVTDMFQRVWWPLTKFEHTGQYEITVSKTDATGRTASNKLNLKPNRINNNYCLTASDYLADLIGKHKQAASATTSAILAGKTPVQPVINSVEYNTGLDLTTDLTNPPVQKDLTPIKKVYCPYNADLIVYDISNKRVDELCGELTHEKFYDLIARINDETKFDGFEYFKCAACELKLIKEGIETDNDFDALDAMKEKVKQISRDINGNIVKRESLDHEYYTQIQP